MRAYEFHNYKNGNYLLPVHTFCTGEYVKEHCDMSLVEHIVSGQYGKYKYRYRLHTYYPTRFEDTLDYDVACPRCNCKMRLCGGPLDSHDQGLYKCPRCEKR